MPSKKRNLLAAAGQGGAVVLAEATDFDGTNDYLSRASDLTGNADGKTLTFSAWVYNTSASQHRIYNTGNTYFMLSDKVNIYLSDGGTAAADYWSYTSGVAPAINTWFNILFSLDKVAGTYSLYINDVLDTGFNHDYTNANDILWTNSTHYVNGYSAGSLGQGRLAHVFLDYDYLDLSVEANRRNFITADLKPATEATQAALSPILYLPMTDPDTAEVNAGTGGNFTDNGTLSRSSRAPNQDNCVASLLDGTGDYLSRTTVTGAVDTKVLTFAASIKLDITPLLTTTILWSLYDGTSGWPRCELNNGSQIDVLITNSAGTTVLSFTYALGTNALKGVQTDIAVSVDLANASNRYVFVNGIDVTSSVTWTTYTDDNMDFTKSNFTVGKSFWDSDYFEGNMGEFYLDDAYIDLSAGNPFWDSDLNKPVSVRKVIDDTGTTPLIALPIIGNDAGNNLGSGGSFTANAGPYVGARGASEFWARTVDFDGSTDYFQRAGLTGMVDSKSFTLALAIDITTTGANRTLFYTHRSDTPVWTFQAYLSATNYLYIRARDSTNTEVLNVQSTGTLTTGTYIILCSMDLADTGKRSMYINGTDGASYSTYTNVAINLGAADTVTIGAEEDAAAKFSGDLGFLYFDDTYTDFLDEATRLLFVDALGYPRDLPAAITAGTVTEPLVYMQFNTTDLEANSGTGGDFTEYGTPVAGGDVNP